MNLQRTGPAPGGPPEREAALGLYLHVPFCLARCPYCDFYSTTRLDRRGAYTEALARAMALAPGAGRTLDTLYLGGGTPSLLGEGVLSLLEAVRRHWRLAEGAEITLEANPGTVTSELLRLWRQAGVNRLSMGIQAGSGPELKTLGRIHTLEEGLAAVEEARRAGFGNVSVDMMLATPGQTAETARELADLLAGLPVTHISAYLLKIEEGTPFARQGMADRCPDPDQAAEIYLAASRRLEERGFVHYEISNFARPGYESRHNTLYWTLDDYLGIGPSAYSFYGGRRFHFPSDLDGFLSAEDPWSLARDDGPGGDWTERLMLALRLRTGLDLSLAPRYGQDPERLRAKARPMAAAGLLTLDGGRIALTDQGFLLSNSIITALLPPEG